MIKEHHRLVIYACDVQRLTGRHKAASYRLLRKIKEKFALPEHALVTIEQFCEYTGVRRQDVVNYLRTAY